MEIFNFEVLFVIIAPRNVLTPWGVKVQLFPANP